MGNFRRACWGIDTEYNSKSISFQVKNVVLPQSLQRAMAAEAEAAREAKAKVLLLILILIFLIFLDNRCWGRNECIKEFTRSCSNYQRVAIRASASISPNTQLYRGWKELDYYFPTSAWAHSSTTVCINLKTTRFLLDQKSFRQARANFID